MPNYLPHKITFASKLVKKVNPSERDAYVFYHRNLISSIRIAFSVALEFEILRNHFTHAEKYTQYNTNATY